jgi:hypothetical protein
VYALIHIVVHVVVSQSAVFIAEKLAKAFGERKGNDLFVHELINGKGN